ncbi:MAG: serine/threonine-protein kinase [Kofleriaceae bacterium]
MVDSRFDTSSATQVGEGGVDDVELPDSGYDVGDVIGRGGMGEVLFAHDRRIGRAVAIKRIRTDASSDDSVSRFLREARVQARLEHPAIVPVYELGYDEQHRPYFTMKKITGVTLAERIEADSTPLQALLRAFADVCLAIQFAHERGVVHRDLKPHNIMLGDFGEVYVLDWGIARVRGDATRGETVAPNDIDTPETKGLLGTPGYMAPEQIYGDGNLGPAADVYALGSTLFEVLTTEPLHRRGQAAIAQTLEGVRAGPRERRPDRNVPPELDAACLAALAKDPAARPTARELATLIQNYLDGDRDLEHRRVLAEEQLALARATSDKSVAMQHAGRALALAPNHVEAAQMLTAMIIEPPASIPAGLQRRIDTDNLAITARQSRSAGYTYLAYFLFLPMLVWQGVTNVPLAIVGFTLAAAMAAGSLWLGKGNARRPVPAALILVPNIVVVAFLTRAYGPFVIAPGIAGATAMVLISLPELVDRPILVCAAMCSAIGIPIVLEALGYLAPTWKVVDGSLVSSSGVMHVGGLATEATVISGNFAMILAMALIARHLALQRRDAVRDVEIQAWNLRQIVPLD